MICDLDLIEKVVHGRVYNGVYLIDLFCQTIAKDLRLFGSEPWTLLL